jgi:glutamine amidotransferase
MCRMMGIVSPHGLDADLVARFRQQARGHVAAGESPGHADGWGIVYYDERAHPEYAGRSPHDAATDPAFEEAVAELHKRRPAGPLLAHVRKASAGGVSLENTHPFLHGRWSFCHNGTVFGLAEETTRPAGRVGMWGLAREGESDSRALFERLMDDIMRGDEPMEAIAALARHVEPLRHTSLTFLLTDGATLWGLRKVGNVDEECRDDACSPDYYTLGFARIGEHTVVSQEQEFLDVQQWRVVPDSHVVIVHRDGRAQIEAL